MILLCPPAVVNCDFGASTKATSDCVGETLKETIPETNVVPSVGTFVAPATATYFDTSAAPETVIDQNVSDISYQMNTIEKENTTKVIMTGNNSADHCVVNYKSDESIRSLFADKEPSVDKSVGDDPDVVIVNDIVAGNKSLDKTPSANVVGRIRSRAGKNVTTVNTLVQKSKS